MSAPTDSVVRRGWLHGAVLVVAAAALGVVFLAGPVGSDDTRYMDAAWKLAHGQPPGVLDHAYARAAFILWLAAWTRLGMGGTELLASQVVVNILLVLALYWIGRTVTGDARAALLGALCWALFPIQLVYAGAVLPDQLGVLLALLAGSAAITALRAPPGRGRKWLAAAGVLSGLAVSVKEPYVLLPLIFASWALWEIRPRRTAVARVVAIGAIALCTFALEYLFFQAWAGDWLYRHREVNGPSGAMTGEVRPYWGTFIYYPRQVLLNPAVSGLFGWLLLIAGLRALHKVREARFIALWSVCFFVLLQFGSATLTGYQPLPMQPRYVHPMIIWLFVPLGRWLADLAASTAFGRLGVILLLTGVSVQGVMVAETRAAQGLYLAGLPRSVERTMAIQAQGLIGPVALPQAVAQRIPPDLRLETHSWPKIDLTSGITDADLRRLREQRLALLVPIDLAKASSGVRDYQALTSWLDRHARSVPVEDGQAFIDRFLLATRIGPLQRRATTVTIARLYLLYES